MSQENIVITLPGSGLTAVIRSYVKNRDVKRMERCILAGQDFAVNNSELISEGEKMKMAIKGSSMIDAIELQCRTLLISIGDIVEDPYEALLESSYAEDMEAIEAAVSKVYEEYNSSREKK